MTAEREINETCVYVCVCVFYREQAAMLLQHTFIHPLNNRQQTPTVYFFLYFFFSNSPLIMFILQFLISSYYSSTLSWIDFNANVVCNGVFPFAQSKILKSWPKTGTDGPWGFWFPKNMRRRHRVAKSNMVETRGLTSIIWFSCFRWARMKWVNTTLFSPILRNILSELHFTLVNSVLHFP